MSVHHDLIRVTYASRATFKPFESVGEVDSTIQHILHQARTNNQKNNLVGALYYGHGCFFQCLEGGKADIDRLLQTLKADPRHKELKILSTQPIKKRIFSDWEMKYATIDHEVRQFLRQHHLVKFDPYRFDAQMTAELVDTLQRADRQADDLDLLNAVHTDIVHAGAASVAPSRSMFAPSLTTEQSRMIWVLMSVLVVVLVVGMLWTLGQMF